MVDLAILFIAGLIGGALNSIAGGGSFVTFPALMLVGVNPLMANATNTFASVAGYISGAAGFRQDLKNNKDQLPKYLIIGLIGGGIGAYMLTLTDVETFSSLVPWLLLVATLLFLFGNRINGWFKKVGGRHSRIDLGGVILLNVFFIAVCTYGGFFNAGLGIVLLSYLALAGETNINFMNGVKLLVSAAVSVIAIGIFIADGLIAWTEGLTVMVGTLVGGLAAAHYSKKISQRIVRGFISVFSICLTTYYFLV